MSYNTKHVVRLSQEEQNELEAFVKRGKVAADISSACGRSPRRCSRHQPKNPPFPRHNPLKPAA